MLLKKERPNNFGKFGSQMGMSAAGHRIAVCDSAAPQGRQTIARGAGKASPSESDRNPGFRLAVARRPSKPREFAPRTAEAASDRGMIRPRHAAPRASRRNLGRRSCDIANPRFRPSSLGLAGPPPGAIFCRRSAAACARAVSERLAANAWTRGSRLSKLYSGRSVARLEFD